MLGGGGVSHPSQLTTGLVIKSVTTSPTLAGERMLFILQVSILSEQLNIPTFPTENNGEHEYFKSFKMCDKITTINNFTFITTMR